MKVLVKKQAMDLNSLGDCKFSFFTCPYHFDEVVRCDYEKKIDKLKKKLSIYLDVIDEK